MGQTAYIPVKLDILVQLEMLQEHVCRQAIGVAVISDAQVTNLT